jgi:beta-lactamase regulating signal transducer with metallopeptidase domain
VYNLGITLLWSAVQVTLVLLAAAGLYLWAARRGPAARALVATAGLGILVLLPLVASCPLPVWWNWQSTVPPSVEMVQSRSAPMPEPSAADSENMPSRRGIEPDTGPSMNSSGLSVSFDSLWRYWEHLGAANDSSSGWFRHWPNVVTVVFLTGMGLGLVRLLFALWALHDLRRRSRRVDDPVLSGLVEELRLAMHCRRAVEVREAPGLSTAATIGWLRPLLLLPNDWQAWSQAERHAVVAHELAHIHRSDFLAGFVARVSVALHFYHPLVYWLANRLHLQQELAADALGASFAGGRAPYLQALARLALRQDGRPTSWPATTFFSARGTLLRRVQMLHTKDGGADRPLARGSRAALCALLLGASLAASALRSPAQKLDEKDLPVSVREQSAGSMLLGIGVNSDAGLTGSVALNERNLDLYTDDSEKKERPAFDLSYLAPRSMGVIAFRPAALFTQPGMKPAAEKINGLLTEFMKASGLQTGLGLPAEEIEQVTGGVWIQELKNDPNGHTGALLFNLNLIRAVKPFDWKKQIHAWATEVVEEHYEGKVYYKGPKGIFMRDRGPDVAFYVPDVRTLLVDEEAGIQRAIHRGPAPYPEGEWAEGWKQVEHSLVAVAIFNRDQSWGPAVQGAKEPEQAVTDLFTHIKGLVLGFDAGEEVVLRILTTSATEEDAATVATAAGALLELSRKAVQDNRSDNESEKFQTMCSLWLELLGQFHIERQGVEVKARAAVKAKLSDMLVFFF